MVTGRSDTWWFDRRIYDRAEDLKVILALGQHEQGIVQKAAELFGCSILSTGKFGDRIAVGYRVACDATGKEFWVWGSDRQMNDSEIYSSFVHQFAAQLAASC